MCMKTQTKRLNISIVPGTRMVLFGGILAAGLVLRVAAQDMGQMHANHATAIPASNPKPREINEPTTDQNAPRASR